MTGAAIKLHCGVEFFHIFRRELSPGQDIPDDVHNEYQFCRLDVSELITAAGEPKLELQPEKIRAAADRGDLFFGVYSGKELVAYRWYGVDRPVPCENGLLLEFSAPGRAYGYRTFTRPDYRGRRLHLHSTRDADTRLAKLGVVHAVGYISARNLPSLRSNARLPGVDRVGLITVLRFGSVTRVFSSRGAKAAGVRMTVDPKRGDIRGRFQEGSA